MKNNDQQPNFEKIFTDVVGKIIRRHRIKQGMTPAELAKSSGLTTEDINQIEQGRIEPELMTFFRIINGLGYEPPDPLFYEIYENIEPDLVKEIENKDKD